MSNTRPLAHARAYNAKTSLTIHVSFLYSSLYRRSLKLALDWAVHRYVWRGQAMYIRGLFEANKHVTEPRQQRVCCIMKKPI